MDSDDLFEEDFDASLLAEADAVTQTHFTAPAPPVAGPSRITPRPSVSFAPNPPVTQYPSSNIIDVPSSDDFDVSYNFQADDLDVLDAAAATVYSRTASTSSITRPPPRRVPSLNAQQMDLFGNPVNLNSVSPRRNASTSRTNTGGHRANSFGGPQRKTKHWDHSAYAKSGWKKTKSMEKRQGHNGDDEGEETETLNIPTGPVRPPPPMRLEIDALSTRHWIYPLNKPKRDYQFNIVKHCLFDNTLVALPTGLGKTFIAGVVMLNYYTWFPKGKVIFVAPTKPLVGQQVVACHQVCGIPGSEAVEMTGEIPVAVRERHYENKRVFYLTPQTLVNDLDKGRIDALDIVLLVIDEAHKGTGDYAYAQIVRYMMHANPNFRVLALTATPGGTPDAVQALVDSLHISRIEIRNEDSLDLRQYMHRKIMKQHTVKMDEKILAVRDQLVKLMQPVMDQVQKVGLLRGAECIRMHPYRPQGEMNIVRNRPDARSLGWVYGVLKKLGGMARAMGYLMESSMNMAYLCLREMAEASEDEGKKAPKISKDPNYIATMSEINKQRMQGFALHPKMVELKSLIIQHFAKQLPEPGTEGEQAGQAEGRVMVFASFRGVVDEIVEVLNQEKPLIRAMKLIGQAADKQGGAGLNQKGQQQVLDRFKAGEGNVLVATSIGEEGLDIGEIDMVICYDAQKTPIRMLQRIGRTGRKTDGYVHILMAEGREEDNWNKSKEAYDNVQRHIVQAEQLELYADVPRLLPDSVHPQVHEQVMEIEEYSRKTSRNASTVEDGGKAPKKAKRKRDDNVDRNAPGGVAAGFQSVGEMFKKVVAKKGKGKQLAELDPLAGTDDDTDREIEAGPLAPSRRASTNRAQPESSSSSAKKPRKRKSDAGAPEKKSKSKKSTPKSTSSKRGVKCKGVTIDPISPTLSERGRSDTDDDMIDKGFGLAGRKSPSPKRRRIREVSSSSSKSSGQDDGMWTSTKTRESTATRPSLPAEDSFSWDDQSIIELDDDSVPSPGPSLFKTLPITRPPSLPGSPVAMIPTRPSSPLSHGPSIPLHLSSPRPASPVKAMIPTPNPPSPPRRSPLNPAGEPEDISWLLGSDEEDHAKGDMLEVGSSPPCNRSTPPRRPPLARITSPNHSTIDVSLQYPTTPASHDVGTPITMPPPDGPFRVPAVSPSKHRTPPEPTFPIGRGGAYKRLVLPTASPWSEKVPSPSQKRRLQRLQRKRTEEEIGEDSPLAPRTAKRVKRRKPNAAIIRAFVDDEAGHSGGEVSEGSSGEDQPESEGDRRFLFAPPETQVPAGYAQTQVYRQSLQTQAPNGGGPAFAARPAIRGRFGPMRTPARRPAARGSSPATELGSEPDQYSYGSFIVDDEDDIVYEEESSLLHI